MDIVADTSPFNSRFSVSPALIRANQCRKLLAISLSALTADLRYPKFGATCERSRYSFVLGNHRFHRQRNHASSCCRLPPVPRSSTPRRRINCARERGRPVRGGEVRTGSLHGPGAYPSGWRRRAPGRSSPVAHEIDEVSRRLVIERAGRRIVNTRLIQEERRRLSASD